MTPRDVLAEAVLTTKQLNARYLAGFTDETRTTQAVNLPNHVAWNLGHCALTMNRLAEKVDGRPLPESDFSAAVTAPGSRVFFTESVAFGSKPAGNGGAYPALARCVEVYNAACDRLAAAVRSSTDAQFNQPTKWGPFEFPWWQLVPRIVFHNGFHTGQVADLRRALGLKSIFS